MHISRWKHKAEAVVGVPRELSKGSDSFTGATGACRGDSRPADVGGYRTQKPLSDLRFIKGDGKVFVTPGDVNDIFAFVFEYRGVSSIPCVLH
jgi:hypothetical protein